MEGHWWVVHTKARHEKVLSWELEILGIGYFLPLVRVQRRYGGRSTFVRIPLFPGYLFLCGGLNEREAVLRSHRAANVIKVADQESLKGSLRQIYRTITSDVPVDLYPGIRVGRMCRIIRGALMGLEGIVINRRSVCRVSIAVPILGQSAEVEVDPELLEVID